MDGFCHAHYDLALACKGTSTVGGQHIVEQQNVGLLPRERDGVLLIHLADMVQCRAFNWRAVAVVDIAGEILLRERCEQRLTYGGRQPRNVKKVRLVEPDALTSLRMIRNGLTNLARAQTIASLPLEFQPAVP